MLNFKSCLVALGLSAAALVTHSADITGAGATFPYPVYAKWAEAYKKETGVGLNYQSIGSSGGIRQIKAKTVSFGASDAPVKGDELDKDGMVQFPAIIGGTVPVVNLDGFKPGELRITGPVLAEIYMGTISQWNDPKLAALNPGKNLPKQAITVVHRADGSGTTFNFTDYLSAISKDWADKVGKGAAVKWPADSSVGGKGNEGVVGLLKQTPNSIAYTEMIYAVQNNLPMGQVQNAVGKFIKASPESVTAAAADVQMPDDFRVSITNAAGEAAYPISSLTWLLIPQTIQDAGKKQVIVEFLQWMLTTGQGMGPALQYAPLPASVIAKEQAAIAQIK